MTTNLDPIHWPTGSLTERRAIFVYETTRTHAAAVGAPIVPEPWPQRDEQFRTRFLTVIEMMCSDDRKHSPEALHNDWVNAYGAMGWRHSAVRDTVTKTHPNMVPFGELDPRERSKDAVFVALCEVARQWVIEYDEVVSGV